MHVTLLGTTAPLLAAWPAHAAAAEGTSSWAGETGAVALVGIGAAIAWHHLAPRRRDLAERWHHLHLAERLHALHLGERLAHSHVGAAISRRLHRR